MEKDKIRLENFVKNLTAEFKELKQRFKHEVSEKDQYINELIKKYEKRIYNIYHSKEGLQDMFLKELVIK